MQDEAFEIFDEIATMGSEIGIESYRNKLTEEIETLKLQYVDANRLRNPFKDVEMYILPMIIASLSWLIAKMIDVSCDYDICQATELAFNRIYIIILCAMIFFAWK